MQRKDDIKKQQLFSKMKREKEAEEKATEARSLFETRIKTEEEERERKEKLAAALVTQEAQLIYRLKKLHSEKQKAIRALASAVDCLKAEEIEEDIEGDAVAEGEEAATVPEELPA